MALDLEPTPSDTALAPDMVRFRDTLDAGYRAHPEFARADIVERRRIAELVRAPLAAGGPVMHVTTELVLETTDHVLRLRVHRPVERPEAVLLYMHGGGWTLFSLDTHDRLMREYAARTGFAVVGLDYALVPDVRFPVPVDQVVDAVRLLHAGGTVLADAIGADPAGLKLAIGGDSAGGNLAAAAAIALRDAGEPALVSALLLNYAVVAPPDPAHASYNLFDGPGFNLTSEEMRSFWDGYCPDPARRDDPRANLLAGRLAELPPTLLHIAGCDVLRDENLALAAALQAAGVSARTVTWRNVPHSFLEAMSFSPISVAALDDAATWLRAVLSAAG